MYPLQEPIRSIPDGKVKMVGAFKAAENSVGTARVCPAKRRRRAH